MMMNNNFVKGKEGVGFWAYEGFENAEHMPALP